MSVRPVQVLLVLILVGLCLQCLSTHKTWLEQQQCCDQNGLLLIDCLSRSTADPSKQQHAHCGSATLDSVRIEIITSYTNNIANYASYALAINSVYASLNSYQMTIINEDRFSLRHELDRDSRWNKVYFLRQSMSRWISDSTNSSSANKVYLLWLDADLAVLDFALNLEKIIGAHSDADVILSRDKASAPFIGNTGAILIRVSPWSLRFLDLWWHSYDRSRCCDQNALTWMFDRDIPLGIKNMLHLLPASSINSDFPCWKHHNQSSQVLHLAGMTTLFRTQVFRSAWKQVCGSTSSSSLPQQLGISKEYLLTQLQQLPVIRMQALRRLRDKCSSMPSPSQTVLDGIRAELLDILKQDDADSPENITAATDTQSILELSQYIRQWLFVQKRLLLFEGDVDEDMDGILRRICLSTDSITGFQSCLKLLEELRDLASLGFELITEDSSGGAHDFSTRAVLPVVRSAVDAVIFLFDQYTREFPSWPEVQAVFLYYQFKHRMLEAQIVQDVVPLSELIVKYRSAVDSWKRMHDEFGFVGTLYAIADPEREVVESLNLLAIAQCRHKDWEWALKSFSEAIDLQMNALQSIEKIRITTTGVANDAQRLLWEIRFNRALCLVDAGLNDRAAVELRQLIEASSQHHFSEGQIPAEILALEQQIRSLSDSVGTVAMQTATTTRRLKKIKKAKEIAVK